MFMLYKAAMVVASVTYISPPPTTGAPPPGYVNWITDCGRTRAQPEQNRCDMTVVAEYYGALGGQVFARGPARIGFRCFGRDTERSSFFVVLNRQVGGPATAINDFGANDVSMVIDFGRLQQTTQMGVDQDYTQSLEVTGEGAYQVIETLKDGLDHVVIEAGNYRIRAELNGVAESYAQAIAHCDADPGPLDAPLLDGAEDPQ